MNAGETFQPVGLRFYSQSMHREMMLVTEGDFSGWIVYKHPDGQWVTLRKATESDRTDLANAMSRAHHSK